DLVDQQFAVFQQEQLHAQHADVVDMRHQLARQRLGERIGLGSDMRGCERGVEDAALVMVLGGRVGDDVAVAVARCDDRQFLDQRDLFFQYAGTLEVFECGLQFGDRLHPRLALAVVAPADALEDAGQQMLAALQILDAFDAFIRRDFQARLGEDGLFLAAVLEGGDVMRFGRDEAGIGQKAQGFSRDVLEFGGDGHAARGHLPPCILVVVGGDDVFVGEGGSGAMRLGIEYRHAIAVILRCGREHPAQLPAAQYAEPGARSDHGNSGGWASSTLWVGAARKAASWGGPASAAANRPALAAPAAPMAKVATGTPFGICTMDRSESRPCRCLDGTGTPSTGTVVMEATMPGRCAAPPAPAMMARRPSVAADLANS